MISLPVGRRALPAIALIGLAACSGAQTTAGLVPSAAMPASQVPPVQAPAVQNPAAAQQTSPLMFTANRDGKPSHSGGLLAFRISADGNVKPAISIAGSNTT